MFLAMARQSSPARSQVNLNEIVQSALDITGYALKSADIDVACELAKDLPPVWADSDQLNQVAMNLIVNAEQAMAEKIGKRELHIVSETDEASSLVRLRIADNGPGIEAGARSRIFEPFFTTKGTGVGTGIGLTVSRGIIEAHDGSIEVESDPADGTPFTIVLPRSQHEHEETATVAPAETSAASCSVLVVDDEPEVAEVLADILTLDGHEVETAPSGNSALRILAEREFDVILTDMRMPDVDGPGLYTRIKNAYPHLVERIVFITGDALGPSIRSFLDQTGLPHLEKPVTPDEMRTAVQQAMARRSAEPAS